MIYQQIIFIIKLTKKYQHIYIIIIFKTTPIRQKMKNPINPKKHSLLTYIDRNKPPPNFGIQPQKKNHIWVYDPSQLAIMTLLFFLIFIVLVLLISNNQNHQDDDVNQNEDDEIANIPKNIIIKGMAKQNYPVIQSDSSFKQKLLQTYFEAIESYYTSQDPLYQTKLQRKQTKNFDKMHLKLTDTRLAQFFSEESNLYSKLINIPISVAKHKKLTSYAFSCHREDGVLQKLAGLFTGVKPCKKLQHFYQGVDLIVQGKRNKKTWVSSGKHLTVISSQKIRLGAISFWFPEDVKANQIYIFGIRATETIVTLQKTLESQYIDKMQINHSGFNLFVCLQSECNWQYSMLMIIMEPKIELNGLQIYQIKN